MHLSSYFQQKPVLRWLLEVQNWGSHSFPCRSQLLSTTVLVLYLPLELLSLQAVLFFFCIVSSSAVAADLSAANLHGHLSADARMLHTTSLHSASAHGNIFNESK